MPKFKKDSLEFLILLIGADVLFILLHLFHTYTPYFRDARYSLETDRGFAEVFQYVKGYWIVLLFGWLGLVKTYPYLAWSLLFGYLVIDDAFLLHETVGLMVAESFDFRPLGQLRAQDFGELTVFALSGVVWLTMIGAAYYWGSEAFRQACKGLVALLVLLAVFGAGVDAVHALLAETPELARIAAVVEDGGEMLVVSVTCWYGLRLLRQARVLSSPEAI